MFFTCLMRAKRQYRVRLVDFYCNIYTQKCWTFVLKALTMADDFDVDVEAMLEAPYRKEVS